nr:immunoglobulin heavy chain junction region [Mus musculus]
CVRGYYYGSSSFAYW